MCVLNHLKFGRVDIIFRIHTHTNTHTFFCIVKGIHVMVNMSLNVYILVVYEYIYLVKHKSQTFEMFKEFQNKEDNQLG